MSREIEQIEKWQRVYVQKDWPFVSIGILLVGWNQTILLHRRGCRGSPRELLLLYEFKALWFLSPSFSFPFPLLLFPSLSLSFFSFSFPSPPPFCSLPPLLPSILHLKLKSVLNPYLFQNINKRVPRRIYRRNKNARWRRLPKSIWRNRRRQPASVNRSNKRLSNMAFLLWKWKLLKWDCLWSYQIWSPFKIHAF